MRSGTAGQNAAVARLLITSDEGALAALKDAPTQSPIAVAGMPESIPAGTHLAAIRDYVLIQAAALLYVGGKAKTLPAATARARRSMQAGAAARSLDVLINEAHRVQREADAAQQQQQQREELERTKRRDEFFYSPEPTKDANVGTTD